MSARQPPVRRPARATPRLSPANPWAWALTCVALVTLGCGDPQAAPCADASDCAALDDDDRCNGTYACVDGGCRFDPASVIACDDSGDTTCAANRCVPGTGACALTPRAEGLACDDGDACTLGDRCDAGACSAGTTTLCDCATDADCVDDGDACNGTPRCVLQGALRRCVVPPESAVTCDHKGGPCTETRCAPATGACVEGPRATGSPCDDGDPCTTADTCKAGACVGAPGACGCTDDAQCPDDGDVCNGAPFCDTSGAQGVCKVNPATVISCSTALDTACRKNVCKPSTGGCKLTAVADASSCDDGDSCTTGDVCVAGSCVGGTDTCVCKTDQDCAAADDGNLCNGVPVCDVQAGKCVANPASVVVCATADDTDCAKTVCLPATGACAQLPRASVTLAGCVDVALPGGVTGTNCLWLPAKVTSTAAFSCSDGNPCTVGDVCKGATCTAGKAVCECTTHADCAALDDGDKCNGVAVCDTTLGKCVANPASVVYCPKSSGSACLKSACDPKSGACVLQPTGASGGCDDGDACTQGETCTADGQCTGGKGVTCDDGDPCTADSCNGKAGCVFLPKPCDDGNTCTVDACDAKTGTCSKALAPKGQACNGDSNGCTVGDACDGAGVCVVGPAPSCSGKTTACTAVACVSAGVSGFSCVPVHVKDGTPCDDGDYCTGGDACKAGVCAAGGLSTLFGYFPSSSHKVVFEGATLISQGPHEGAAVLAGHFQTGAQSGSWWVHGLQPSGQPLWAAKVVKPPAGLTTLGAVATVLDRGSSGALVVGYGVTQSGAFRPVTVVVPAGAPPTTSHVHGSAGWQTDVRAAAAHPVGNLVVVGAPKGSKVLTLGMTTLGGTPVWTQPVDTQVYGTVHVVARQDGTIVAAVENDPNFKGYYYRAWTANGKVRWTVGQGGGQNLYLRGTHVTPAGTLMSLFSGGLSGPSRWLTLSVDNGTNLGWNDLYAPSTDVSSAVQTDDGRTLIASRSSTVGAQLGGADGLGNGTWLRQTATAPGVVRAMAVHGGRVLLAGSNLAGSGPRAAVVDRWGFGTCAARGACAGLEAKSCDDKDGCTADGCHPVTGCVHLPKGQNVCDPGMPCADRGTCSTGSCQPEHYGRTYVAGWGVESEKLVAGLTLGDDGAPMAWRLHVESKAPENSSMSVFQVGEITAAQALLKNAPAPHMIGRVTMRRNQAGAWAAAGTALDGSTKRTRLLRYTDGYSKVSQSVTVGDPACKTCDVSFADLAASPDGSWLVAANVAVQGGRSLVARVTANGTLAWTRADAAGGASHEVRAVHALANGGAMWVGASTVKGTLLPWMSRVTVDNKAQTTLVDPLSQGGRFHAATQRVDGTLVAVGGYTSGTVNNHVLVATSPQLKTQWRRSPAVASGAVLSSVLAQPDGGLITGGTRTYLGEVSAHLARWTSEGQLVWSRTHRAHGAQDLSLTRRSLLQQANGGLVAQALWWDHAGGMASGILRADDSGHTSCQEAGGCASLKDGACNDKNACTVDWCDPKTQCKHLKLTGPACAGGGTCKSGVCQP